MRGMPEGAGGRRSLGWTDASGGEAVRNRPRYLVAYNRRRTSRGAALAWILALAGWAAAALISLGYLSPLDTFVPPWEQPGDVAEPPEPVEDVSAEPEGRGPDPDFQTVQLGRPVNLVDPGYPLAHAGDEGWGLHYRLVADLTGDGRPETVHLIARVERSRWDASGFAWDDGHLWQVYVEDADGSTTHVFSRWVQIGTVRAALIDDNARPDLQGLAITTLEGAGVGLYRIAYRGPGDFDAFELVHVPLLAEAGPAAYY